MNDSTPPELEKVRTDVAAFLERCEKRGKSSGSAGCLLVVVSAIVLASIGALSSGGGWAVLVIGSFVLFGALAKQAVKRSVVDFQHTFRSGAGAWRRDTAVQLLWERAHGAAAKSSTGKAAKELLDQLGIRARPTRHDHEAILGPPPVVVVETAPPEQALPAMQTAVEARPPAPPTVDRARSNDRRPASAMGESAAETKKHVRGNEPRRTDGAMGDRAAETRKHAHETAPRGTAAARAHAPTVGVPPAQPIVRAEPLSGVPSGPPPSSPPLAPSGMSFGSTPTRVVCDYCGNARTLPAGEASSLCPNCFPQIRLEG